MTKITFYLSALKAIAVIKIEALLPGLLKMMCIYFGQSQAKPGWNLKPSLKQCKLSPFIWSILNNIVIWFILNNIVSVQ